MGASRLVVVGSFCLGRQWLRLHFICYISFFCSLCSSMGASTDKDFIDRYLEYRISVLDIVLILNDSISTMQTWGGNFVLINDQSVYLSWCLFAVTVIIDISVKLGSVAFTISCGLLFSRVWILAHLLSRWNLMQDWIEGLISIMASWQDNLINLSVDLDLDLDLDLEI